MTFTNPKTSVVAATILGLCLALCTANAEYRVREKNKPHNGKVTASHVRSQSVHNNVCTSLEFQYGQKAGVYTSYNTEAMLQYTYRGAGFSFRPWDGAPSGENWAVALALQGIRRTNQYLPSAPVPFIATKNHQMFVDYGAFAVEYQHTLAGTRQNFLVRQKIPGSAPLAVELECTTELPMRAEGGAVMFYAKENASGSTPIAWYKDLHVWDAVGQVLPAHMELSGTTVRLVVDDRLALYPVTIDPISGSSWTTQGAQAGEQLGYSIAGNFDANNDGYPDVLVAAPCYDNGEQANVGRVMLFLGTDSGLSTTASWTAYGDQAGAMFGRSVASAGDVNNDGYDDVIIGAPLRNNTVGGTTYSSAGKVYVYMGNSSGLSTTASWTMEANQNNAEFGWSVASAGDINNDNYDEVIIGAPKYNNSGQKGKVFVYKGSSSGLLTSAYWTAESDQVASVFGYSVASAGDVNNDGYGDVIIGAPLYDNGQTDEGRAFVYLGSSAGLASTPAWTAESNQTYAEFGHSVAAAGNVNNDSYGDVVVGAPKYDNGQTNEGRVYLFLGNSSGVASSPSWTGESNQDDAEFGSVVASAGDVNNDGYGDIIVGAPLYDNGDAANVGRVYIYGGTSGGSLSGVYTATGEYANNKLGTCVANAGRVNNNSKSDFLASAAFFSSIVSDGGKSYLITDPELIYTKRSSEMADDGAGNIRLSVFPNPCLTGDAKLEFWLPIDGPVTIDVINNSGGKVYQRQYNFLSFGAHSLAVPINSLANGHYAVRIVCGGHSIVQSLHIVR